MVVLIILIPINIINNHDNVKDDNDDYYPE